MPSSFYSQTLHIHQFENNHPLIKCRSTPGTISYSCCTTLQHLLYKTFTNIFSCYSLVRFIFAPLHLHQFSLQTDLPAKQTRELCASSLHRPTGSSQLHYLDYSESDVHLKTETTGLYMQDRLIHEVLQSRLWNDEILFATCTCMI